MCRKAEGTRGRGEKERRGESESEEEDLREEMKKNKAKFAPIPQNGVPSRAPIIPAASVVRKMDRGEYVPLWCYTKEALKNAKTFALLDMDNTLTLVLDADGSTSVVPASNAKESKGLVEDHDLTLGQFQVAAMRMLTAMHQSNWPLDRIQIMEAFWTNILDHPYQTSIEERDQLALMLYQSDTRKQWFMTINSPAYAHNISEINKDVLREARDCARYILLDREDKRRVAAAVEALVSTIYSSPSGTRY